ncbi:immunity protein 45 of polymorphic toxin system [Ciceribacter lividus]|uniref:Immunity protein 45 of polymorphic toxin system n=1 Tax=Ciceribacter lividus TaxID=1197950 RepID=A0A6I7HI94_9HYPH|nr:Imm45 family immunity protein [Ciceribacter lividus]RCW20215.1 immunity protein 45 of polymorphic toxin system [Ciceribacter lividus]
MKMERLVDCKAPALPRGTVFRLKGRHPYEESVDFMLVLDEAWANPLVLVVATGYSAGHVVVSLPPECMLEGTVMLSTAWLLENWSKWVYPDCAVEDVHYLQNYPVPRAE